MLGDAQPGRRRAPRSRSAACRPATAQRPRARPCRTGWSSRPAGSASSAAIAATGSVDRTSRIGRSSKRGFSSRRRAERREPAGVDDRHAIAALGLVQVVRRHEHGRAAVRQVVDQPPELAARHRIDAAGRLVEKDDRRLVQQRAAERQPLPPAAGQVARELALASAESGHLEHELPPRARAARRVRPYSPP